MTLIPLSPSCVSRPGDRETFAPLLDLFPPSPAGAPGLRLIAQRYFLDHGSALKNGAPAFVFDRPPGSLRLLDPGAILKGARIPRAARPPVPPDPPESDLLALQERFDRIEIHHRIVEEMLSVSGSHLWLFVFPRFLLLQANDIGAEIRALRTLFPDIAKSTLVRRACTTLCLPPQSSSHDRLSLVRAYPAAMEMLAQIRPDALAGARAEGVVPAPLSPADLDAACPAS